MTKEQKPYDGIFQGIADEVEARKAADIVERLRKRVLLIHDGSGDPLRGHWNLSEGDSLLHREAADEIERLRAAAVQVPVAREGWQMVPVEPTQAMMSAGHDGWLAGRRSRGALARSCWSAMLASAPPPSAEPVATVLTRVKDGQGVKRAELHEAYRDLPNGTLLYAAPPPPEGAPVAQPPACPFAVFDEFGTPCDDRVQDYAARAAAGAPVAQALRELVALTNERIAQIYLGADYTNEAEIPVWAYAFARKIEAAALASAPALREAFDVLFAAANDALDARRWSVVLACVRSDAFGRWVVLEDEPHDAQGVKQAFIAAVDAALSHQPVGSVTPPDADSPLAQQFRAFVEYQAKVADALGAPCGPGSGGFAVEPESVSTPSGLSIPRAEDDLA